MIIPTIIVCIRYTECPSKWDFRRGIFGLVNVFHLSRYFLTPQQRGTNILALGKKKINTHIWRRDISTPNGECNFGGRRARVFSQESSRRPPVRVMWFSRYGFTRRPGVTVDGIIIYCPERVRLRICRRRAGERAGNPNSEHGPAVRYPLSRARTTTDIFSSRRTAAHVITCIIIIIIFRRIDSEIRIYIYNSNAIAILFAKQYGWCVCIRFALRVWYNWSKTLPGGGRSKRNYYSPVYTGWGGEHCRSAGAD